MNTICGLVREAPGEAVSVSPILAALAGHGACADEWSAGRVALGCRRVPAGEGGEPALRFLEPGLAVAADARLADGDLDEESWRSI